MVWRPWHWKGYVPGWEGPVDPVNRERQVGQYNGCPVECGDGNCTDDLTWVPSNPHSSPPVIFSPNLKETSHAGIRIFCRDALIPYMYILHKSHAVSCNNIASLLPGVPGALMRITLLFKRETDPLIRTWPQACAFILSLACSCKLNRDLTKQTQKITRREILVWAAALAESQACVLC